ncbi:hypothetical protein CL633_04070 [bacterium]|nr:hypothetical protein [bacterium]|tara:strand:+ start:7146 stop:9008 length:1863 start_codon:yes stop_codon:yes gene_type:complete
MIPIESFFDSRKINQIWPKVVCNNKDFTGQIEQRKKLRESLENVITLLPRPDIRLDMALNQSYITAEQATKLYKSLGNLLDNQDYRRIIFYLPFEFLPNRQCNYTDKELQKASERFFQTYMQAWQELLTVHDVRANFIDGDVLEIEHRNKDLPRVVKAVHLTPKLVEKNWLMVKDVIMLLEKNTDQILKNSIADTLPVLADLGLLVNQDIQLMQESSDWLVRNMARIIVSNIEHKNKKAKTLKEITFSSIQKELNENFFNINAIEYGQITEKREKWLKQDKKKKVIQILAQDMSKAIINSRLTNDEVKIFFNAESVAIQQVLIEGIRMAIESVAVSDIKASKALYARYQEILLMLWKNHDSKIREVLSKTFRRFHVLGIVHSQQLEELDIIFPYLAGPFSKNLELIKQEMNDTQKMASAIELNLELAQLTYPVVLVFGSCVKGYGEQSADIDIAVFVRPGISFESRPRLQSLLKKTFAHPKIGDNIIEFWLEKKKGYLGVRDFNLPDAALGESYWTHVLFGADWQGNRKVIYELYEKLLVPYMHKTNNARGLYLEELERDALQYRLMHKGYERFFPAFGGINTPHADAIDSHSMFWDSGYRELATKLFANKVFLPKISKQ